MSEHRAGDEREEISQFLDWYRVVVVRKLRGLDRSAATSVVTSTGMNALGIVKHLAWVERRWFGARFRGDEPEITDNPGSFLLDDDDTVMSVVADYESACAASREAVASAASIKQLAVAEHPVFGFVTLRWILLHMIEETARHAGHLDVLRELTDGVVGD